VELDVPLPLVHRRAFQTSFVARFDPKLRGLGHLYACAVSYVCTFAHLNLSRRGKGVRLLFLRLNVL